VDRMRVTGFTTLAASTRKARGVPRVASRRSPATARKSPQPRMLARSSPLRIRMRCARFTRPPACEKSAVTPGRGQLEVGSSDA
jgi:hypothetical protein